MCCKFLRTVEKVSGAPRSGALVQLYVMPTCTSIKPANNLHLQIVGENSLGRLHTAIKINKKDPVLTNCFFNVKRKSKDKPVETDNSAADNDQANCETRKSDDNDHSS